MNKSLVIIQDVPTQFDVPLYNQIADEAPFQLFVIYTQVVAQDAEIGRMPQWDHIREHRYQHHFLKNDERKSVKRVVALACDFQPEHVIISGYWPKLHRDLLPPLRRRGISIGLRSDNTLQHSRLAGIRGLVKRWYLKKLLARYDVWHPVGNKAANYLKHLSAERRTVSFFSYNIDNRWFCENARASRRDKAQQLTQLGFSQESYVILGVMKWSEREDPMTLLYAFEQYQQYNANARLVLIGDGPLKAQVNERVNKLGDLVHTPGYASYSQLPHWYGLADVFVHPSPNEPWGVSVSEALASGVPVIASTGVGAAIEQVSAGINGFVFEPGNIHSLVDALKKWQLIADVKTPKQISHLCESALDEWNYQTTIENFQGVLNDG